MCLNPEQQITLGDLFDIKRGVATGANKFFILDEAQGVAEGIPEEFLIPILPSPRYTMVGTVLMQ